MPNFGDARIEGLDDAATELEYADPLEESAEVRALRESPEAQIIHASVLWGQLRGNRDATELKDWTGRLHVNRGTILVRRTLQFEGRTDQLLPRTERSALAFTSLTRPHRDGLIITIIDPTPDADEPLVLSYENRINPEMNARVSVASLLREPQSMLVDRSGNRMLAAAVERGHCGTRIHLTPNSDDTAPSNGFLAGVWRRVGDNRGEILGRVRACNGRNIGHVRGVYGRRQNGRQVFFAKYINLEGRTMGLLRGSYGDGQFTGRWVNRDRERGTVRGYYRSAEAGNRHPDGVFIGTWSEHAEIE